MLAEWGESHLESEESVEVKVGLSDPRRVWFKQRISIHTVQWTAQNPDGTPSLYSNLLKEPLLFFTATRAIQPLLSSSLPWCVKCWVFFPMKRVMSHSEVHSLCTVF